MSDTQQNILHRHSSGQGTASTLPFHGKYAAIRQETPAHVVMTVVMPVFNEAKTLGRTLDIVLDFARNNPQYRFLFVNDGSTDRTQEILSARVPQLKDTSEGPVPRVAWINYLINNGKGYAVRVGFEKATSPMVCFMDGDLAYSLNHLFPMVEELSRYDVVIGSRNLLPGTVRAVWWPRRLLGGGFNRLVRWGFRMPWRDTQAGIKGFQRDKVQTILPKMRLNGFSFDVELLTAARRNGHTIGEIPAKVSENHARKPSSLHLLTHPTRMAFELLRIRANDLLGRYKA